MKRSSLLLVVLYTFLGSLYAADSYAAIYKYVDKNGVVCFADDLQAVPQNYRASAVIVEGDAKEDAGKAAAPLITGSVEEQHVPASPAEMPQSGSRPLSFRLMVSVVIMLAAFGLFMAITRQTRLKENQKTQSLIRTSLVVLVCGYLIVAHAKDVMTVFGMAGKAIDDVQQRSAEKGRKAAQAIKTLDTMFEDAQKAMDASPSGTEDGDKK